MKSAFSGSRTPRDRMTSPVGATQDRGFPREGRAPSATAGLGAAVVDAPWMSSTPWPLDVSFHRRAPLAKAVRHFAPWDARSVGLALSRWKKKLAGAVFQNAHLRDAACLHALCQSEADSMRAYGSATRSASFPTEWTSGARRRTAPPTREIPAQ